MLCFSSKLFSGGRPELLPSRMLDRCVVMIKSAIIVVVRLKFSLV